MLYEGDGEGDYAAVAGQKVMEREVGGEDAAMLQAAL